MGKWIANRLYGIGVWLYKKGVSAGACSFATDSNKLCKGGTGNIICRLCVLAARIG